MSGLSIRTDTTVESFFQTHFGTSTLGGSFSAVSKPRFASTCSLYLIVQHLLFFASSTRVAYFCNALIVARNMQRRLLCLS